MCLVVFSYQFPENLHLVFWANRDEFRNRRSLPARYWTDCPDVWGGRDLQAGGAWLGVEKSGRFAFLTNYRNFYLSPVSQPISRGSILLDFFRNKISPSDFWSVLQKNREFYEGYNLVWGDESECFYYNNRLDLFRKLGPGIYGLSNGILDENWKKLERAKNRFSRYLVSLENSGFSFDPDTFRKEGLATLSSRKKACPWDLPRTGIGFFREWALSSVFIDLPGYGTRSSSLVYFPRDPSGRPDISRGYFYEKNWDPHFHSSGKK